jgi:hypothetical protein
MARAAPDGYTIEIGSGGTHVANGAIYQFPHNVLTDFEPNRAACERSRPDRRKSAMKQSTLFIEKAREIGADEESSVPISLPQE